MVKSPLFSVVITSHAMDRLNSTYELLDSIEAQTYPNIEVIFVVERSGVLFDRVKAYTERKSIPAIRVLFNEGKQGASAARNLGIEHSRGDIIAFIDDDALAFPDWVERMVTTYEDDSIIAVTGVALPLWEDRRVDWFPEEFYWIIGGTGWGEWKGVTEVRNVWTMNASFRREAFEQSGLFATLIGPQGDSMSGRKMNLSEDVELSLRVKETTGKRIVLNPDARVRHRVTSDRLELGYIVHWAFWMGFSKHKLKRLYSQIDADPLGQEHQLLKRIITDLLPRTARLFFKNPLSAWNTFRLTLTVLLFVTLGYCSHATFGFLGDRRVAVERLQ